VFGVPSTCLPRPLGLVHSTFEQALPPDRLRHAAAGYDRNGRAITGKRYRYPEMAAPGCGPRRRTSRRSSSSSREIDSIHHTL
jgi:hypothetical protein